MKRFFLLLFIATFFLTARSKAQSKEFINSAELIKPNGYTHAIVTGPAKTIYISGEVPFNTKGELIGKGDFNAQLVQVYENIKKALISAGATFDDVVKMTTFVVNYNPEYLKTIRTVRSNYLSKENPPTNTTVGVQTLSPNVLVEIEAIAVIK